MRLIRAAAASLMTVALTGCSSSTGPWRSLTEPTPTVVAAPVHITGVVAYADGSTVNRAQIMIAGVDTTFSDSRGSYDLLVPANLDSVTLRARDGFAPGAYYTYTTSGSMRAFVAAKDIRADIALTFIAPF